jgi:small subunit ribosomal protein S16
MVNEHNEKLVALNYDRIRYWLGQKARMSGPVAELLGLSGFLPVHPRTYLTAWRSRLVALGRENLLKADPEAVEMYERATHPVGYKWER